MTDIEQLLLDNGCKGAIYIPYDSFNSAIIGVSDDGRIVYDYEAALEYIVINEGWSIDEAIYWLDGIIRFIPISGDKSPIIMYRLEK